MRLAATGQAVRENIDVHSIEKVGDVRVDVAEGIRTPLVDDLAYDSRREGECPAVERENVLSSEECRREPRVSLVPVLPFPSGLTRTKTGARVEDVFGIYLTQLAHAPPDDEGASTVRGEGQLPGAA